jgi:DNA polymerase III subunit delta'
MNVFSGLMGHARVQEVLTRMIERGTLPHAFLFVGPKHVGKSTIAQSLIRHLLDTTSQPEMNPDYHTLTVLTDEKTGKDKSSISVKQVRELTGRLSMSSLAGSWKIVWIEDAEKLSMGAANALLKTLEEPKGKTMFILRASEVDQLPATIVSRCQTLRFSQVAKEEIIEGLVRAGFAPRDAKDGAARSMGRPGLALRYLKDTAYRSTHETGVAQARAFLNEDITERFARVMEMIPKSEVNKSVRLSEVVYQLQLVCRDALMDSVGCSSLKVLNNSEDNFRMSADSVIATLDRLSEVRRAIPHNINPHLALEHVALSA